jgi:hypothetical protein
VALGLIAAPEIPEEIAIYLAAELPGLLGKHVDDRGSWDVSVVDPLTGTKAARSRACKTRDLAALSSAG